MAKDPIKKASNRTYYFRANLGYHPITQKKQIQKYCSGFKTKKEAREKYSKLILTSPNDFEEPKYLITFGQFIEDTYFPWYKTQVKESTYLNLLSAIQKHFKFFYQMPMDKIKALDIQNWQLDLSERFNPNYIRILQGSLSIAFDRAIILELIEKFLSNDRSHQK